MEELKKKYAQLLHAVVNGDRSKVAAMQAAKQELDAVVETEAVAPVGEQSTPEDTSEAPRAKKAKKK